MRKITKILIGLMCGVMLASGTALADPAGWSVFRDALLSGRYAAKFTSIIDTGLTASLPLSTDATKQLATLSILNHRTLLGLGTADTNVLFGSLSGSNVGTTQALGDNSTKLATTAYSDRNASNNVASINSKSPSQAVAMTAAESGSSGINVGTSTNFDVGTGSFSLVWKGSFPDWTPASSIYLMYNLNTGTKRKYFYVQNDGTLVVNLYDTGFISTVAPNFVDGTTHLVIAVISRSGGAGTVTYYVDGYQLGTAVALTGNALLDLGTGGNFYISGNATTRYASTNHHAIAYNRALSAAEVLTLYQTGSVAESDKWGSQTDLMLGEGALTVDAVDKDALNSSYTILDAVLNGSSTLAISSKVLTINIAAEGSQSIRLANSSLVIGKRYRLENLNITSIAGTWRIKGEATYGGGNQYLGITSSGVTSVEITAATTSLYLVTTTTGNSIVINQATPFLLKEIGATLALQPEGIGVNSWFDSSSNGLNASYPTTGATLTRPLVRPMKQGTVTAKSTSTTVTIAIADILSKIITASPATPATYTLEAGATSDAIGRLELNGEYAWSIINTGAGTITLTSPGADHTIVGLPTVVTLTTGKFKTVKTAANTFITYRDN